MYLIYDKKQLKSVIKGSINKGLILFYHSEPTAASKKSKLQTAISLSFFVSFDLMRWCQASSTWRMLYEISKAAGGWIDIDIFDVPSHWFGLAKSTQRSNSIRIKYFIKPFIECVSISSIVKLTLRLFYFGQSICVQNMFSKMIQCSVKYFRVCSLTKS